MIKKTFCIVSLLFITSFIGAQEAIEQENEEAFFFRHSISIGVSNSFIPNTIKNSENNVLIVPTVGFNYDYWLSEKWGIGIHSDLSLQNFEIEREGREQIVKREAPFSTALVVDYKLHPSWIIYAGYGAEWEKSETLQLLRLGTSYGIELEKNWELGFSLGYDYKINAFSTFILGLEFTKRYKKQKLK